MRAACLPVLLAVVWGCGPRKPPFGPASAPGNPAPELEPRGSTAAPASGCRVNDHLLEAMADQVDAYVFARFLGSSDVSVRDCTQGELIARGLELQLDFEIPEEAVVDFQQWSSIDSSESFLRLRGLPADFDVEAATRAYFDRKPLEATEKGMEVKAETFDVPTSWAVHPETLNQIRGTLPEWWDLEPGDPGVLTRSQEPAVVSDCRYPRGSGRLSFATPDALHLHSWSWQHFYPRGGCGA